MELTNTTYAKIALLFATSTLLFNANAETTIVTETVVVTATREEQPEEQLSETVAISDSEELDMVLPAHPSELLNRQPGVHINNLGGEGHMTSIRQPISTGGVYLFLENGIPTRPTGLFNHNALYEINVPLADRIEVTKGPGSALYGSDSIGGIINTITKSSPDQPELSINPEYSDDLDWKRLLTTGGTPINDALGIRVDLNLTDSEGFREASEYSRHAATVSLDGFIGDQTSFKTVLSYSAVEQSGASGLEESAYKNDVERNIYQNDAGRRNVDALRLSTEFQYEPDNLTLYTVTPFFRDNQMALMPSWMLTYDPNDRDYQFQSFGLITKYRRKLPEQKGLFITGIDIDFTPSDYKEVRIETVVNSDGDYIETLVTDRTNYDFEADQISISTYVHSEWQLSKQLRLNAGVRYDYFHVDYDDRLDPSVVEQQFGRGGFTHKRPDSQTLSYDNFSPKLGAIYQLNPSNHLFSNYRRSFRAPSIGQLFRSGSTDNTTDLSPVITDSVEIGVRGRYGHSEYDVTLYHMRTKDDIVTYIDNDSNTRTITNAGETLHQGLEIGLGKRLSTEWLVETAWSFTHHEYRDFTAVYGFPSTEINYRGNDIGKAPENTGNLSLQYLPMALNQSGEKSTLIELEWEHVGEYFTDETNEHSYEGHDLLNLRAKHQLTPKFEIYGRLMNIEDKRYATYTSNQVGKTNLSYRPGMPRSLFIGFKTSL